MRHMWMGVGVLCCASVGAYAGRAPGSGLYAIWYGKNRDVLLDLPFITGGQAVTQWRTIEPRPEEYDFSSLDVQLRPLHERGYKGTVQINGNQKPLFLFERVPWHPERFSVQIRDEGSLMFWHPAHVKAHQGMIRALGAYLARTPYRDAVLGVRLNFNAFGTEHCHLRGGEARSAAVWTIPKGVASGTDWSKEAIAAYQAMVFREYLEHIVPHARVFVRNGLPEEVAAPYRNDFESGRLSWFHTSSEAEPRAHSEWRYRRFHEDCRSGKTTAYAEPWASAWGDHGGKTDDRACSPPQWNYWRLLIDLHNGVSFVAIYGSDLEVARTGRYRYWKKDHSHDDTKAGTDYRGEFTRAFEFAARYAGHPASPAESPGAWCAFRGNDVIREANGVPAKRRKLSFYTGDYDFLMHRVPGDGSEGLQTTGPEEQRFGAWARRLPVGKSMGLQLDAQFAESLAGKPAVVAVTYLDDATDARATVSVAGQAFDITREGTGRWCTAEFAVPALSEGTIVLRARDASITLHMVEVRRGQ